MTDIEPGATALGSVRHLSLNQEQELSIRFLCVAHPLVRPAHSSHDVAFVVNFNHVNEFARAANHFIEFLCRRPATRTVRQDDVTALCFS